MKKIYIAAFHTSKFGKLLGQTVPEILSNAVTGACRSIGIEAAALDVASVGAACNFSLNEQGLLSGLLAMVPGLESKPMEAVENACASGGQAVLSVIQKLQLGLGETGIAVGCGRCATPAPWTASSSARCWATSPSRTSGQGRHSCSRTSLPR
ncbi:MAG: hypothetical protein QM757_45960 [Paludibaculum sp.]